MMLIQGIPLEGKSSTEENLMPAKKKAAKKKKH